MSKKLGGDAGTPRDTDDQRKLRALTEELTAIMRKHEVGGVVILSSRESAAWLFEIPNWAGLTQEPRGLRVRISSRTPALRAVADSTMHMVGTVRDMALDVATLFDVLWRNVEDQLGGPGSIQHRRARIIKPEGD
jgi:hypothetical protein